MKHRFRLLLLSLAFSASVAPAQVMSELGAYVKGEWDATATPEFSIVLFRWGARDSALSGKDLLLGQVASLQHSSFTMVLRSTDPSRDGIEVRLEGGVQIFGEGREPECSQCLHRRKYNGTTLISRGAYMSDICCFTAVIDQPKGVTSLEVVDMQAGGRSVPYIVKFNTKPLIVRNGLKVPIPTKSNLHPASVSVKTVAVASAPASTGETVAAIPPPAWSGTDEAAADRAMRALAAADGAPEIRIDGATAHAGPFYAAKDGTVRACDLAFSLPNGLNPAGIVVSGPGFRLRGMDQVRAFATAVRAVWTEASRASGGRVLSSAKFPPVELADGAMSIRSPVRAVLVPETGGARSWVRLETVPSAGGAPREILTTKLDYFPAFLKLLNPQPVMKRLGTGPR